jgi:hypothetical protein
MLWDPSFESWRALKIVAQPVAMLFSKDGKLLKRYSGRLPEKDVLSKISGP